MVSKHFFFELISIDINQQIGHHHKYQYRTTYHLPACWFTIYQCNPGNHSDYRCNYFYSSCCFHTFSFYSLRCTSFQVRKAPSSLSRCSASELFVRGLFSPHIVRLHQIFRPLPYKVWYAFLSVFQLISYLFSF